MGIEHRPTETRWAGPDEFEAREPIALSVIPPTVSIDQEEEKPTTPQPSAQEEVVETPMEVSANRSSIEEEHNR